MTDAASHYGIWTRAFVPKKAVAFEIAKEFHSLRLANQTEALQAKLDRLERYDRRLSQYVRSELRAYGDNLR